MQRPWRSARVVSCFALVLTLSVTIWMFGADLELKDIYEKNSPLSYFDDRLPLVDLKHTPSPSPPPPNITIIAIWNPNPEKKPQKYLPNFFASFSHQPNIDLLFIIADRYNAGCATRISPQAPNIEEICFDMESYWALHVDFLCKYWTCTEEDRPKLLEVLLDRGREDFLNSHFRPFRAGVFAKYLNPETPYWGWCDQDIMLGSLARKFPWDVAPQFDLIIPAQPADVDYIMLFMSGHLMFFRHSPYVWEQFLTYPRLTSLEAFLGAPYHWIDMGAEELEYSHFAMTNQNLTFMHFGALSWTSDHLSTVGDGVYSIDHTQPLHLPSINPAPTDLDVRLYLKSVVDSRRHYVPPPTFSAQGMEYTVALHVGEHPGSWIPQELVVHYEPDYKHEVFKRIRRDQGRRYVMRRAINGPVTERIEPPDEIVVPPLDDLEGANGPYSRDNHPYIIEYLYIHYQVEKYAKWWTLPKDPIKRDDIVYMNRDNGIQAWHSDGDVFFNHWVEKTAS